MSRPHFYYYAGAPNHPGTTLPANVTGNCPHHHRSYETAERCIRETDRAIKRGNGPAAYCDRQVMVYECGDRYPARDEVF
jgi:hypothetical protein